MHGGVKPEGGVLGIDVEADVRRPLIHAYKQMGGQSLETEEVMKSLITGTATSLPRT